MRRVLGIRRNKMLGFSLSEILFFIVLASVISLAVFDIQKRLMLKRINQHHNGLAHYYIHDVLEQMRSNKNAVALGFYTNQTLAYNNTTDNAAFIAHDEITTWKQQLKSVLPEGKGVICNYDGSLDPTEKVQCNPGGKHIAVGVEWKENNRYHYFNMKYTL